MAIHPHHAEAILAGRKKVEFRKRALASAVSTVVIYATSPVKAIVGEFAVDGALVAAPGEVWSSVGAYGAIDKDAFNAYYAGATTAAAIRVLEARTYPAPVPLSAITPEPAVPQSFTYIADDVLSQVRQLGDVSVPLVAQLGGGLPLIRVLAHADQDIATAAALSVARTRRDGHRPLAAARR